MQIITGFALFVSAILAGLSVRLTKNTEDIQPGKHSVLILGSLTTFSAAVLSIFWFSYARTESSFSILPIAASMWINIITIEAMIAFIPVLWMAAIGISCQTLQGGEEKLMTFVVGMIMISSCHSCDSWQSWTIFIAQTILASGAYMAAWKFKLLTAVRKIA